MCLFQSAVNAAWARTSSPQPLDVHWGNTSLRIWFRGRPPHFSLCPTTSNDIVGCEHGSECTFTTNSHHCSLANPPCTLSIRVRAHRFVGASVQLFALWPEWHRRLSGCPHGARPCVWPSSGTFRQLRAMSALPAIGDIGARAADAKELRS